MIVSTSKLPLGLTIARSLAAFMILLLRCPLEPSRNAVPASEQVWEILCRRLCSEEHPPASKSVHVLLKAIAKGLDTSHACRLFTLSTSFLTPCVQ